jgi:hypothetical protein
MLATLHLLQVFPSVVGLVSCDFCGSLLALTEQHELRPPGILVSILARRLLVLRLPLCRDM